MTEAEKPRSWPPPSTEAEFRAWWEGIESRLGEQLRELGRGMNQRIDELEQRLTTNEHEQARALRDSVSADREQSSQITLLAVELTRLSRQSGASAGQEAGGEAGATAGRKWAAVTALISLASLIVQALLAQHPAPPVVPPRTDQQVVESGE